MSDLNQRKIIDPDCRGGASTSVVLRPIRPATSLQRAATKVDKANGSYFGQVLRHLHDDQNLIYLAARLQNYSEITDARLGSLRQAVQSADLVSIADIAHALTDATAKLGAIRMMKLCIALQMVGRRGLIDKAGELVADLELEYARFKENLIYAVG